MLVSVRGLSQGVTNLKLKTDRLQHAKELEQEAIKKRDSTQLAEAWYLYGKIYAFAGDYKSSQSYFLKSLQLLEPKGDSFEVSRLYVRLSENEVKQGHLDKALHDAKRSLSISEHIRSDPALMRSYGALGQVYEAIWHKEPRGRPAYYSAIILYYRQIEYLGYKSNDTIAVAEALARYGNFLAKNDDKRSVSYLQKALSFFTRKGKDIGRLNVMIHLSSAYSTFGQFKLAGSVLRKAEALYDEKKLNEYDLRVLLDRQFVRYFEATDQWEAAFERLNKLNALEKAQLLSDYDGTVTRLNIEYETRKKESILKAQKKVINLNAENLHTQQILTAVIGILFLIATVLSIVFFRLYRKNQRISLRNVQLVKEQNHRVKNNLQVVSSLLSLQSKRLTDEVAKKAIEESRLRVQSMAIIHQRLYDGDRLAEVNLEDFIRELVWGVLRSYGYSSVETEFTIENTSLPADKAVPLGLILNELTTNACKYAFPYRANPELKISCHRQSNRLKIMVADNGPGMDGLTWADTLMDEAVESATAVKKSSFGMQLIQAQTEQLYGTCRFEGDNTGVLFTLEFNV
ncbi:histidine kinase dimerization/phosphoacceptor domain -containing protein [Spirosoma validum]|uniref:histidine kinase n=1 Tax=Spirosoma validum TaxID=2771355 RepID=A0A927GBG0_9BACT|nr:histidine kinase dimerization/phosphoacceptor domain -containing protein [Spirosoma validum]MBD2751554.1 tetratricopeptide repeat protein [Spirosoma validum]